MGILAHWCEQPLLTVSAINREENRVPIIDYCFEAFYLRVACIWHD